MFSDSDSRTGRSSLRTLNIGAIGAVDTFGSSFIGGGGIGGSGSIGSSCGISSIGGGGVGSRSAGGSGISGRSGRDRRRGYEEHDFDAIDIVLELGELAAGISGSSRDSITPRGQRDSRRYTVHSDFEEVYETEFSEKKLIEENEQPGSVISITSGEESNNETSCTPDKKSVGVVGGGGGGGSIERPEATLMGRAGTAKTVVDNRRGGQHKRPISRRIKPHSPDSVPLFLKRSQGGSSRRAPDNPATSNMEFLRGVYAFMQVSRSSGNHVKIDSAVFRLHTNATVILLVTFSIAVTTRQYVGNPIDCVHTRDIPEDVLNTYCWIHSTYTVVDAFMKKQGQEVPFPGVDNSQGRGSVTIKHTKYYQWVAFTLFFQAILFYTPRWLWKSWEGGKINALMMDLDIGICSESEKKQKKKLLLDYLWDNLRYHNWWAYRYYVCEFLSLVNVIGQMFLMNRFFDGEFMTFGLDVIAYMEADQEDRMDPMIYIFPRMTKCTFYKYGVSGEVERHDAICILPLNVVNEKIYIFLWFWFILLSILTALTLIYRIVIIFSPRMRVYLLRLRFRLVRRDAIEIIVRRSKMGDWFLLYMLGENIDSIIFRDIMQDLATRLGHNQHHRVPGLKGEIQDA